MRTTTGRFMIATLAAGGLVGLAGHAAAQDANYWTIQYGPVAQLLGRAGRGQHPRPVRDLLQPRRPGPRQGPGVPALGSGRPAAGRQRRLHERRTSHAHLLVDPWRRSVAHCGDLPQELVRGEHPPRLVVPHAPAVQRGLDTGCRGQPAGIGGPVRRGEPLLPEHDRRLGRAHPLPSTGRFVGPGDHRVRRLPGTADEKGGERSSRWSRRRPDRSGDRGLQLLPLAHAGQGRRRLGTQPVAQAGTDRDDAEPGALRRRQVHLHAVGERVRRRTGTR